MSVAAREAKAAYRPSPFRRLIGRRDGRPVVWAELLVAVWLLWLYDEINNLAPLRRVVALHDAAGVLALERSLDFAPELRLDRWVAAHAPVGLIASYYYVAAHFFVTFGLLAYMWWRRTDAYRPLRTQLVVINLIGFAVFWLFPVAPPRMLITDGFRDVIALTGAVGDFHRGGLAKAADQYAAMPSLHIAWATWCCIAVWSLTPSRRWRIAALIYPLVTAFVVIATGNHFVLDVLAGASVALAAALVEKFVIRRLSITRRLRRRGPPAGAVTAQQAPLPVATPTAR
ncbi:MAG TPA: phosphatase PAP2 family protein [Solirubrobacteraceae bacterium]|nr:phosphatase PAP2 family protein [Solirubrobacteraceae bacterium]